MILPALAHNHDYYWERDRFQQSDIGALLDRYFPPDLLNLRHACINSLAQTALRERRNLGSILIPNVFDFETPPPESTHTMLIFGRRLALLTPIG